MLCKVGQFLHDKFFEDSLVDLCPNELLGVVVEGHYHVHDVDQQPEGVLLIEEEQGDSSDAIKTLFILFNQIVVKRFTLT